MQTEPKNKKKNLFFLIVLILLVPFLFMFLGRSWLRILDFSLLYMMLASGLNLVVGFTGLLDLGYIAFYAVGAYTWAFLASPQFDIHLGFYLILPLGAFFAAFFGVFLGFPTLKLRGDYLAIVTLGFGEMIRIFMNNLNFPVNITNGSQGIDHIDPIYFGAWDLSKSVEFFGFRLDPLVTYYYLFLFFLLLGIWSVWILQKSPVGRAWAAIREDEWAAKSVGIQTRNLKLMAFSLGATFGGIAGCLFASFQKFVSPESFSLMESINILTMIVLGGMGHIWGVLLGAGILSFLPELLRITAEQIQKFLFHEILLDPEILRILLLSLGMIGMMLLKPRGLVETKVLHYHKDT